MQLSQLLFLIHFLSKKLNKINLITDFVLSEMIKERGKNNE